MNPATFKDSNHGVPTGEEETYRVVPPEPPSYPQDESPADSQIAAAPDPAKRRKRKRRKQTVPEGPPETADVPPPPPFDSVAVAEPEWKADSGWRELPLRSAVWFPFAQGGWKLLLVYSLLFFAATMLPIVGSLLGVIVLVLHSVLLLETANNTLDGIACGPEPPDWLNWETISAGLMGLVAFLIAGLPLLFWLVISVRMEMFVPAVQLLLLAAGLFYVPMAFLALAERQEERALNPRVVFRGMRKLAVPYVVLCVVAAAAFLLPQYAALALESPPVVQRLMFSFLWVYVSTSLLRAVALAARARNLTFFEASEDAD